MEPTAGISQLTGIVTLPASLTLALSNRRSAIALLLFDNAKVRDAGNVTIPVNCEIPAVGSIVECRYLYAFRESGKIYQPVYLGVREDIDPEECTTAQLKFKNQPEEAVA